MEAARCRDWGLCGSMAGFAVFIPAFSALFVGTCPGAGSGAAREIFTGKAALAEKSRHLCRRDRGAAGVSGGAGAADGPSGAPGIGAGGAPGKCRTADVRRHRHHPQLGSLPLRPGAGIHGGAADPVRGGAVLLRRCAAGPGHRGGAGSGGEGRRTDPRLPGDAGHGGAVGLSDLPPAGPAAPVSGVLPGLAGPLAAGPGPAGLQRPAVAEGPAEALHRHLRHRPGGADPAGHPAPAGDGPGGCSGGCGAAAGHRHRAAALGAGVHSDRPAGPGRGAAGDLRHRPADPLGPGATVGGPSAGPGPAGVADRPVHRLPHLGLWRHDFGPDLDGHCKRTVQKQFLITNYELQIELSDSLCYNHL